VIDVYDDSAVDHRGVYGCAFERDDDTAYFYLMDMTGWQHRIISAFDVHPVTTMPADITAAVRFSSLDDMAGLLINGRVLAVYELCEGTAPLGRWATEADQTSFAPN
jgi:hypothetical protein